MLAVMLLEPPAPTEPIVLVAVTTVLLVELTLLAVEVTLLAALVPPASLPEDTVVAVVPPPDVVSAPPPSSSPPPQAMNTLGTSQLSRIVRCMPSPSVARAEA